MEAPSLQDLRRPITSVSSDNLINCVGGRGPEHEEEEEEDSFFELELTIPRFHSKIYSPPTTDGKPGAARRIPTTVENAKTDPKHNFSPSKRKILPIESSFLRPQSPISLLKSAPKFRVFMMFRRSKSVPANADNEKTELRNRGKKFFTLRFQLKEVEPALRRDSSLRRNRTAASCSDSPLLGESNSRRFSKEAIQKYLRLVKPLYVRVSRRKAGGAGFSGESPTTASLAAQTPGRELHLRPPAGSRVVSCRHLGKSKSASASVAGVMSPARRDDSLVQQHDGIEGAILHCKRSFSSSRAFSDLSRSASAHETTSQSLESARSSSGDDTRSIF